jgi:RNA polymerase sigma-54 factor
MAIVPKLELRQSQTLVMTPQLQQAIKLLQLSNLELSGFVAEELERNPILDQAEDGSEPSDGEGDMADDSDGDGFDDNEYSGDQAAVELTGETPPDGADQAHGSEALDTDYSNQYTNDEAPSPNDNQSAEDGVFPVSDWGSAATGGGQAPDTDFGFEQTLSNEIDLKEHLHEQLQLSLTDMDERLIGAELIDHVDEAGYLTESIDLAAERLGCPMHQVEQVLEALQQFEPTGVFARDLSECLALQLKERNRYDPAIASLLDNLDMLAAMDIDGLSRVCGVDEEDVRDMILEIKALDPKPGLVFTNDVAAAVIPDVFVREQPDGSWMVELNNETLPRLIVNRQYYAEVSGRIRDKEEKSYLVECLQTANWLVKALDQRARTILKVATELVRQQDGFFTHGVSHLRPLNLRAIAEKVDIHESTVSRVTANKFMSTPRGMFELKYFFTSAIASADGGADLSSEAVRERIRELIDEENPRKILSDDKLVILLRHGGVDIARRTVAKYRESMGIPSSVQRRRAKRMAV